MQAELQNPRRLKGEAAKRSSNSSAVAMLRQGDALQLMVDFYKVCKLLEASECRLEGRSCRMLAGMGISTS